jgi:hypothetical protein
LALVRLTLDPDRDSCPCGSGNVIARCCLREDGSMVPASVCTPVPAETGYSHSGCYAAALGGCSSKISREHAISRGVLELIAGGCDVDIGGLAWLADGERRVLPSSALASNVLCRNHNSALSGLDAFALRLVGAIVAIWRDMTTRRRRRPPALYLFNGEDLERWMLKCLCGLVASGTGNVDGLVDARRWRPPRWWLECLFGLAGLPRDYGLRTIEVKRRSAPFEFSLFVNSAVGPFGLAISLIERDFVFAMSRPSGRTGSVLEGSVYRPTDLWTTNHINNSILRFGWSGVHENKTVQSVYPDPRRRPSSSSRHRP